MKAEDTSPDFADIVWLFTSANSNRGVLRQNLDEAALLWKAARASSGPILEIGRRHGGSTALLAAACPKRAITSIDLSPAHDQRCESIFQQIAKAEPSRLNLIVGDSRRTRHGEKFGFLFVDGDHTYDGVKADVFAHWGSLASFDGVAPSVVFHDAIPNDGLLHASKDNHHEGVRRFCEELVAWGCAEEIARGGSSVWLRKIADLPSSPPLILQPTNATLTFGAIRWRQDVAQLLAPGAVGIELGVAEGVFAERILEVSNLTLLVGVDMYAGDRGHDAHQQERAAARLAKFGERHRLLRMRFEEAVDLFPDEYFDFVYVDGYAHTGEEGGSTFEHWWPKLKPGGVFAGDDYDPAWPEVVREVGNFLTARGLTGYIIPNVEKDVAFCKYPTWFTFKN